MGHFTIHFPHMARGLKHLTMAMSGNPQQCVKRTGDLTVVDAGFAVIEDGRGSLMNRSAGRPTITAAGRVSRATGGSGCPAPSGLRAGFHGEKTTAISAGHHFLPKPSHGVDTGGITPWISSSVSLPHASTLLRSVISALRFIVVAYRSLEIPTGLEIQSTSPTSTLRIAMSSVADLATKPFQIGSENPCHSIALRWIITHASQADLLHSVRKSMEDVSGCPLLTWTPHGMRASSPNNSVAVLKP